MDMIRLTRRGMTLPTATLTHLANRMLYPTPGCLIENNRPADLFPRFETVPIFVPADDRVAVPVA